jgi:hypothetical protein
MIFTDNSLSSVNFKIILREKDKILTTGIDFVVFIFTFVTREPIIDLRFKNACFIIINPFN